MSATLVVKPTVPAGILIGMFSPLGPFILIVDAAISAGAIGEYSIFDVSTEAVPSEL